MPAIPVFLSPVSVMAHFLYQALPRLDRPRTEVQLRCQSPVFSLSANFVFRHWCLPPGGRGRWSVDAGRDFVRRWCLFVPCFAHHAFLQPLNLLQSRSPSTGELNVVVL